MSKLSQLAETLIGSEIVRLGNDISNRISRGEKIYNYTIGDFNPDIFPIPKDLEDCIVKAYRDKRTNYPPGEGILKLRTGVGEFIKESENVDYAPNEILIASGGRPLIYALFRTIVDRGDKVIYAVPSWNNNHYVHINEGQHCVIKTSAENDFMPTAADIAPHLAGATLLCLCTPQNPTGTTLGKEEMEKICDLVLAENATRTPEEKKLYVMFDQMYFKLTYGTTEHHNPVALRPAMKEYTILVDGISKVFAATGVRIGWALGPVNVIAKMKSLLTHIGAWAPMAEQVGVAEFFQNKESIKTYLTHFKAELEERLWSIYNGFKALKEKGYLVDAVAPQAAIYLTIKFDLKGNTAGDTHLATQADVTQYLLDKAKLAVMPFYAFGAPHDSPWYRLSIGTCRKEDIPEMLGSLEHALEQLNVSVTVS
ncbi:MAG: pyridoxal phosphate-dependent aminotransferase [Flavipsychrobacter sp.]|nr:pyridoxal phosphate-dependent aminotransferase [Flavipsychrobacter sp.]